MEREARTLEHYAMSKRSTLLSIKLESLGLPEDSQKWFTYPNPHDFYNSLPDAFIVDDQ